MISSLNRQLKSYTARRLHEGHSLIIGQGDLDGRWEAAELLTDFSFPWSDRDPPATEFRALWDSEHLLFRFDVTDPDVVLGEGANAMQKVTTSDRVELFFSTSLDLNPYYAIEMDPRGEVLAYEGTYHRQMNWDWCCEGLAVHASVHDLGYVVEASIPMRLFQELGCLHRDSKGSYLIAGLYRAEFSHREEGDSVNAPASAPVIEDWISWVDPQVATPDFHVPSSFGTIRLEP